MMFNEAYDSFDKYSAVHHSKGTRTYYKGKEKQLRSYFGQMKVDTISKETITDFIIFQRKRNNDITNSTLNKYVAALKFILKNECGIVLEYRKLTETEKVIPVVPNHIIKLVFKHYEISEKTPQNQRNYLMFRLLLDTGLRINELRQLRISNLDFDTSTIHVKVTKTNSERYTFFTEETHMMLTKYIISNHIKDFLFINFKNSDLLTVDNVLTICYRLQKKLNINVSISPHRWRHTFATNFLKRSKDIEVLRLILGHKKLSTTQKYLHLDKEYLHEIYFK